MGLLSAPHAPTLPVCLVLWTLYPTSTQKRHSQRNTGRQAIDHERQSASGARRYVNIYGILSSTCSRTYRAIIAQEQTDHQVCTILVQTTDMAVDQNVPVPNGTTTYGNVAVKKLLSKVPAKADQPDRRIPLVLETFRLLIADLCQQYNGGHPG